LGIAAANTVFALEDLNREFTEGFFRSSEMDEDARIRIAEVKPDEGLTVESNEAKVRADTNGPSWVGKFLQLSIVFLLGLIVYLLSRKKRAKGRFE
jgi:hypothetical protein